MSTQDLISMRHPALPGEFVVVPRSLFEGSYSHNGWVEAKSPAAKAAIETPTSSDVPTASKEK